VVRAIRLLAGLGVGLLAACALNPTAPAVRQAGPGAESDAAAERSAAAGDDPVANYPVRAFPAQTLYALLAAETAGIRGDVRFALDRYREQAHATGDPGVIARAAQIAEYAGDGADLVLVSAEGPVQVIGRIHRGGAFSFELPASLDLSRVPNEARLPPDAKFRSDQERAVIERRMAAMAASYDHPAAAVRRLHAGDGWQSLEVQPAALNVGRYAIAYQAPGGSGMLVASNTDLHGIALPGDHVLAFVYADRAGTVRGTAIATNAMGLEVPNDWSLALQPGWNLVTSEQTANLARIAYRSGAVPGDLAWYAIDPRTREVSLPGLGGLPGS